MYKGLSLTPTAFICNMMLRSRKAEIIEQTFIEAIDSDTLVKFKDSLDQDKKDLLEKTRTKYLTRDRSIILVAMQLRLEVIM